MSMKILELLFIMRPPDEPQDASYTLGRLANIAQNHANLAILDLVDRASIRTGDASRVLSCARKPGLIGYQHPLRGTQILDHIGVPCIP